MENKKFLNEETYQKNKNKITKVALIVLILGVLIGGSLIATGLIKQSKVNSQYSNENKASLQEKIDAERKNLEAKKVELETKRTNSLETEKKNLEAKKVELEAKIKPIEDQIKSLEREPFTGFNDAYYEREDKIEELEESIAADKKSISVIEEVLDESFDHCAFDEAKNNSYTSKYCSISNNTDGDLKDLSVIEEVLDESFDHCTFDEAKNNTYTSKYCSYKQQLDDLTDFNRSFNSFNSIPFYMFGAFVIIASCMIAGSIYMFAKRREIVAFTTQQIMPVAKEGIDEMAPTIGNVAKEISKGIKEGIKDDKE